jgi:hypothetical protein
MGAAVDLFCAAKSAEGASPRTVEWYRMIVGRAVRRFGEARPVDAISAAGPAGPVRDLQLQAEVWKPPPESAWTLSFAQLRLVHGALRHDGGFEVTRSSY